ncbi:MAG: hypothetical protein ACYC3X_31690, partial [Pirellulaceae bacterium]
SDPQGLTALLDRYLLWMETHHYARDTVTVRRLTLCQFLVWCHGKLVGGWWLVVGGWWLVVGGWWLVERIGGGRLRSASPRTNNQQPRTN